MNSRFRDTSEQDRPLAPRARRWPLLLGGGALIVITAIALGTGGRLRQALSADAAVSAARLGIATVGVGPLTRDVAGEGRVVAAQSPTLYAQGGGTATLLVKAGDPVRQGQVLARVDSPELTNRLAQERSNVDALRADLARAEVDARQQTAALHSAYENARIDHQTAQNDLARQTQAFEAGATARMQVDRAQDALAKAKLALDQAASLRGLKTDSLKLDVQAKHSALARQQLLVADLERQVAELQVRSPVDGQVGQLFVADRTNVTRDARLLSVIDLSALEVQMQVAESFARELQPGMPGEISGGSAAGPALGRPGQLGVAGSRQRRGGGAAALCRPPARAAAPEPAPVGARAAGPARPGAGRGARQLCGRRRRQPCLRGARRRGREGRHPAGRAFAGAGRGGVGPEGRRPRRHLRRRQLQGRGPRPDC
jgi:HlyD family secretion protein